VSAILSDCGRYRYRLTRGDEPRLPFVMLNPSTADAKFDDATIRRCLDFARRERRPGIEVVNLFAYRATDPRELERVDDPCGPDNDAHLIQLAQACATRPVGERDLVVAWGAVAGDRVRHARVVANLLAALGARLVCLGTTQAGWPRHPLYVAAHAPLVPWSVP
jgi:hypothetical protein